MGLEGFPLGRDWRGGARCGIRDGCRGPGAPLPPAFHCTQFSSQPWLFLMVRTKQGRSHRTRGQLSQKGTGEAGAYRQQVRSDQKSVGLGQWCKLHVAAHQSTVDRVH